MRFTHFFVDRPIFATVVSTLTEAFAPLIEASPAAFTAKAMSTRSLTNNEEP